MVLLYLLAWASIMTSAVASLRIQTCNLVLMLHEPVETIPRVFVKLWSGAMLFNLPSSTTSLSNMFPLSLSGGNSIGWAELRAPNIGSQSPVNHHSFALRGLSGQDLLSKIELIYETSSAASLLDSIEIRCSGQSASYTSLSANAVDEDSSIPIQSAIASFVTVRNVLPDPNPLLSRFLRRQPRVVEEQVPASYFYATNPLIPLLPSLQVPESAFGVLEDEESDFAT